MDLTTDGAEQLVREALVPIDGIDTSQVTDFARRVGDARVVLLGEATSGTSEFHRWRARLTRELVMHHGFNAVAVDSDWADTTRLDRHVRLLAKDPQPWRTYEVFPQWLLRNYETVDFLEWLRAHNAETRSPAHRVGFFGLDVCGWFPGAAEVLRALEPESAQLAASTGARLSALTPGALGVADALPPGVSLETARSLLPRLRALWAQRLERCRAENDRWLGAVDDPRVRAGIERSLRALAEGSPEAASVRAQHLFDTLLALFDVGPSKTRVVVWAHNTQAGDVEGTELGGRTEVSLGHLCRRHFRDRAYLVGFGAGRGTVMAAPSWGAPGERVRLRVAPPGSLESLMHEVGVPAFSLPLREKRLREVLQRPMLQRSIGVTYRPEDEPVRYALSARVAEQFDELTWFEETRALCPLSAQPKVEAVPDTWPFGV